MTWNIEGLQRNVHSLNHFIDLYKPALVFLSEPQTFQCDLSSLMKTLQGKLFYHLNSEDFHQPDLALDSAKAKGGTMAMWAAHLDPFISVIPASSSSVLAIVLVYQTPKFPAISASTSLPLAEKPISFLLSHHWILAWKKLLSSMIPL